MFRLKFCNCWWRNWMFETNVTRGATLKRKKTLSMWWIMYTNWMIQLRKRIDAFVYIIVITYWITWYSIWLGPQVTKWVDSYLRGRTQRVNVDDAISDPIQLREGAVQGSIMGCRLYKKYVKPLGHMLKRSKCDYHGYADDNSIWKSINPMSPISIDDGSTALNNTIERTRSWMFANKLCLNDSKTEFIVFGLKMHMKDMQTCSQWILWKI